MSKKKLLAISAIFFFVVLPVVFAAGIEIPEGTGLSEDSFAQVFDRILNWMLMIFVILATMAFVITGLQFIFSFGGASGTQEAAKKNLTYTIIAIFIVGGALIILNTVVGLLGDAPAGSSSGGGAQSEGFDFGTYDGDVTGDDMGSDGNSNPMGDIYRTNTPPVDPTDYNTDYGTDTPNPTDRTLTPPDYDGTAVPDDPDNDPNDTSYDD
jgi:hypothetical protein